MAADPLTVTAAGGAVSPAADCACTADGSKAITAPTATDRIFMTSPARTCEGHAIRRVARSNARAIPAHRIVRAYSWGCVGSVRFRAPAYKGDDTANSGDLSWTRCSVAVLAMLNVLCEGYESTLLVTWCRRPVPPPRGGASLFDRLFVLCTRRGGNGEKIQAMTLGNGISSAAPYSAMW